MSDTPSTDLVHPATGEVIDLAGAATTDLADAYEALKVLTEDLAEYKAALVREVARRLDARGTRSAEVGTVKLTTNAPTEEVYDVATLRAELVKLAEEGVIEEALIDEVIVAAAPKPPEPKVDKRKINVLKGSDDHRVKSAIAAARNVANTSRTLKIERLAR